MKNKIIDFLIRNMGLKILAFILAFILWLFARHSNSLLLLGK